MADTAKVESENIPWHILLLFQRALQECGFGNVCEDVYLYLTYLSPKHLILQQLIYISVRPSPNPRFASNILKISADTVMPTNEYQCNNYLFQ